MLLSERIILIVLATIALAGVVTANKNQATLKADHNYLAPLIKDNHKIDGEYVVSLYPGYDLSKHIEYLEHNLHSDGHDLTKHLRELDRSRQGNPSWIHAGHDYKATHLTESSVECIRRDRGVEEVLENYLIELWDANPYGEHISTSAEEMEALVAGETNEAV